MFEVFFPALCPTQVDEVSMLIEGLKAGTIPPSYIDSKKKAQEEEEQKKHEEEEKKAVVDEKRKEDVMKKVEEIKANLDRKNKARERYARYLARRESAKKQPGGTEAEGAADLPRFATDYTAWDLWTPSDEVRGID